MDILRELHEEGKTVLLITHDQTVAKSAEKVFTMADGKLSEPSKKSRIS